MKLHSRIIGGLLLIIAGLIFTRIALSSAFSVDGIALSQMNDEIASLDRDNMILKEAIYTKSSLTAIASDAATLGFVEEKSDIALKNSSPLALKQ